MLTKKGQKNSQSKATPQQGESNQPGATSQATGVKPSDNATKTDTEKNKSEFLKPKGYVPKENEKGLYHVKLDKPAFDPKTGTKISKDYIQMFTVAEWNSVEKNLKILGYTIEVIWKPA
jgi:hypothetical protein